MFYEPLPETVNISGREYEIITDFREWIRFIDMMNDKEIIDRLKDSHYEINLEENQKYMKKKYEEARKAYPDDDLMFSITYHDGKLCYSFHPTRLIEGRASVLVRIKDGKESYKLL